MTDPDKILPAADSPRHTAERVASSSFGRGAIGIAAVALVAALAFAVTRHGPASAPAPVAQTAAAATAATAGSLEARVAANPDDTAAWVELGQTRLDAEDFAGAVTAFRRATVLAPTAAGNWSALGEASIYAAPNTGPPIPDDAVAAFRRAIALDPRDARARYFLATKKDVDGDHQGAISDWLALLADTPRGAPWEDNLRRTIQQVGARNGIAVQARLNAVRQRELAPNQLPAVARAIPGPTREQMQAAAALPKGQQDMMVDQMVDGLQRELDANPRQPDRWLMLMRSRMTLGQTDRAGQALRTAMAANPGEAERLRAEAHLLGVPGS